MELFHYSGISMWPERNSTYRPGSGGLGPPCLLTLSGSFIPFCGLSFLACKVEVALQPPSHFASLQSVGWVCSAHSQLAGFLQVGLPGRGLLPPWLPWSSLLTQTFLEALYKRTRLSTEIAHGAVVTFPYQACAVLSKLAALCSSH